METSGIARRDVTDIILISMPWAALHRTPIQLGILQSVVQKAGFTVATRCFNLTAMEYLASQTKHLPKDSRITFDDYVLISEKYYEVGLGDWIFAIADAMTMDFSKVNAQGRTIFMVTHNTDNAQSAHG